MLQIRPDQIEAFSDQQEQAFIQRMVVHLRTNFRNELFDKGLQEAELDQLVRNGVERAEEYEVINEDDVQLFVECMVLLEPDFDQNERFSWAGNILQEDALDGEKKMDQMNEYLLFGLEQTV